MIYAVKIFNEMLLFGMILNKRKISLEVVKGNSLWLIRRGG